MSRISLVVMGLCLSFMLGVSNGRRQVFAAEPAACPKFECKTIHAYWSGIGSPSVWAYFLPMAPGALAEQPTASAHTDLFTDNSTEKNPLVAGVNVNIHVFDACGPWCGKDPINKLWQAPQQVSEMGMRNPNFGFLGVPKNNCTAMPNGAQGPKSADQSNQVDPGTPPGVVIEAPPAE